MRMFPLTLLLWIYEYLNYGVSSITELNSYEANEPMIHFFFFRGFLFPMIPILNLINHLGKVFFNKNVMGPF